MNFKRYIFTTLALFIFIFLYETLVHDFILQEWYQSTNHVWRSVPEMESKIMLTLFYQLALSAWVSLIFSQFYKNGGIKSGLLFGLFFGVFGGILTSSWYIWLPVPEKLGLSWFINGIIEGLGGGYVLGLIYGQKLITQPITESH